MLQPKLVAVYAMPDYNLRLAYETGEVKIFDVKPYIKGTWYGELLDNDYFSAVRILPGGSGVVWPNGQDLAPHELYENSTYAPPGV